MNYYLKQIILDFILFVVSLGHRKLKVLFTEQLRDILVCGLPASFNCLPQRSYKINTSHELVINVLLVRRIT
jgi:hypothetical protein